MGGVNKRRNQDVPDFLLNQRVIGGVIGCDGGETGLVKKILVSRLKGNLTRKSIKINVKQHCSLKKKKKEHHTEKTKTRSSPDFRFTH